jgi:NRPS condensation-like uncharacterized protein
MKEVDTVRLNKHDFLMFSLEDVITAQTQLLYFRFNEPIGAEDIREAMRYMLTIYPKLRSVIMPTFFSWRYRILDDDSQQLEVLFNDAFRVEPDMASDTREFEDYARNFLNESFSLQQGLPLKMRYFSHGPQPILLVSMHHTAGDGVSWINMLMSLRKYLNGERPPFVPLDNPSMLWGVVKKPFWTIPKQLWQSYKLYTEIGKEYRGDKLITPTTKSADYWGPVGLYPTFHSRDFAAVKKLSKALGYSINVLQLTALAMACSRGPARESGNTISIAMSIDLRPYFEEKAPLFGNYVSLFPVRIPKKAWDDPMAMLKTVDDQMKIWIERFKNKQLSFPILLEKMMTVVGKKYYAWGARIVRKQGKLNMSFAFSTLGSFDIVNKEGTRAQICELRSIVPQYGVFVTSSSLSGRTITSISYPEAEYSRAEIEVFYQAYEKAMDELLALVP